MQFESAVQTLCDSGVEFIIIGGLSATLHGSTRATYDLDICYERGLTNLRRLAKALAPFHPRPRNFPSDLPFVWDEATLRQVTILTLRTDLGEIDLLAEVAGVGAFQEARKHAIHVEIFDRQVLTLDLTALIRSKRAVGRAKDLSDLAELESLLEAGEE